MEMKQITAKEALEKSKEIQISSVKLNEKLIEVINVRIQEACYRGNIQCSLNSIDDSGNGVRGIGLYLSSGVIKKLFDYYSEHGFRLEYGNSDSGGIPKTAYLKWGYENNAE